MLRKSFFSTGIILSLMFFLPHAHAQVQVNLDWQASNGSPAEGIDYSVSTIDNSGNLIVAGNTITTNEAENFLISKFDGEGNLTWEVQYDFGDSADYATGIITDDYNNIYITGASKSDLTDFDYATVKLNSSGVQQWSVRYDGTGSGEDVPVDIKIDYQGNLYVTGVSQGSSTGKDFATIKYNTSGVQQWAARYDFANLKDGAVGLILDDSTQRVTVTGASASSATAWDFATVSYDYANGNQQSIARQSTGSAGYNSPVAITKDNSGNIYLTGSAITSSATQDIQTVKLDTSLAVVWTVNYDDGQLDAGSDIKVDNSGNIFVAGYTDKGQGLDFITIGYDGSGTELWAVTHSAENPTDTALARFITLDEEGNLIVTGEVRPDGGGDASILTVLYNADGELLSEETYTDPNAEGIPTDLRSNLFGSVYLTGKTNDGSNSHYFTVKYSVFQSENNLEYNNNGDPSHVANQFIVRFDEDVVSTAWVDNTDLNFGRVDEIITDTALVSTMGTKLGEGGGIGHWKMSRLYRDWPTTRTTAVSRLGRTIELPKLWSTFILYVPKPLPETVFDEFALSDSLNTIPANKLRYAHPNVIAQLDNSPNDPSYANNTQASLWFDSSNPNVFTDADINVAPAWNLLHNSSPREPKGKNSIKVGVYDTGIRHTHEDIRGTGNHGGLSGSIVDQGFDYLTGSRVPIQANAMNADVNGHGTAVTGIIGALRNNNTGVAGIAGGDISVDNDAGVHFISMRMSSSNGTIQLGHAIAALGDAVQLGTNNRPLFDIMNNSWGQDSTLNTIALNALTDAMYMAHKAEIVIVNGRGNAGNSDHHYPATFPDDWGISVGSSGEDGERYNNPTAPTPDNYASSFGKKMDVIASGVSSMIFTTDEDNDTAYEPFSGTSGATPHVTGLAGLLMSYSDQVLAPEDVEHIIEFTAADKNLAPPNPLTGYDDETGWGLIDAGAAVQLIQKPFRRVRHYLGDSTNAVATNVYIGKRLYLTKQYDFFVPGTYDADVFQVEMKIPLNLTAGEKILSVSGHGQVRWVRNSGSNLWGPVDGLFTTPLAWGDLNPWEDAVFVANQQAPTPDTLIVQGYYYAFPDPFGGPNVTILPKGADVNPQIAFTVVTHDSTLTNVSESFDLGELIYLYPNPAQDYARIQYSLLEATSVKIDLLDMQGREVKSVLTTKESAGIHRHNFMLNGLGSGVYLCRVKLGKQVIYKKLIKS